MFTQPERYIYYSEKTKQFLEFIGKKILKKYTKVPNLDQKEKFIDPFYEKLLIFSNKILEKLEQHKVLPLGRNYLDVNLFIFGFVKVT